MTTVALGTQVRARTNIVTPIATQNRFGFDTDSVSENKVREETNPTVGKENKPTEQEDDANDAAELPEFIIFDDNKMRATKERAQGLLKDDLIKDGMTPYKTPVLTNAREYQNKVANIMTNEPNIEDG